MYNKINAALLAAVVFGVSSSALAEPAIPSETMLANNCNGCHGPEGASKGPSIPSVGGLNKEYFIGIMEAYRKGTAYSTIMGRVVAGYSEDEVEKMADYYASKPFVKANQEFNAALAKEGKKLHKKYCESCHEDGGAESSDAGVLAGQWAPYLQSSIVDFQAGNRKVGNNMLKKLAKLVKKDPKTGIDAIVHYYASQKK